MFSSGSALRQERGRDSVSEVSSAPIFAVDMDFRQDEDAFDLPEIPVGTAINVRVTVTRRGVGLHWDRKIILRIVPFMLNGEDVVLLNDGRAKQLDRQPQLLFWNGSLATTVSSLRGAGGTLDHSVTFCAAFPGVVHFAAMASLGLEIEKAGKQEEEEAEELCWSSHPRQVRFL